jgi:exopolysaccharide production repressor protein
MFAPRVFLSMIGALAAFAVATYYLNGSLASTAIQTLICAVLIQVGYFLVWKEARERRRLSSQKQFVTAEAANDEKQPGKVSLRRLNRPHHLNS